MTDQPTPATPTDQEVMARFWDSLVTPDSEPLPGLPDDDDVWAAIDAYAEQERDQLPALPDRRALTDPPPLSLEQERYLREVMRLNGLTAGDFNDAGLSPRALLNEHGALDAEKIAAAIYHLRSLKWG